jgi:double-stranded uracil-DNA glycosylase
MTYAGPSAKGRRRKAAAHLPGQRDLMGQAKPSVTLPPKIPKGVHTLFLGLGPGLDSAIKGRYFPGSNNYFWKLLFRSGLWPTEITCEQDDEILAGGFGLADVIERPTQGTVLATKAEFLNAKDHVRKLVAEHKPRLVAFIGLQSYRTYLRRPDAQVEYGLQDSKIGDAAVFVLPSTSGASAAVTSYAEKLDWFKELARVVQRVRTQG